MTTINKNTRETCSMLAHELISSPFTSNTSNTSNNVNKQILLQLRCVFLFYTNNSTNNDRAQKDGNRLMSKQSLINALLSLGIVIKPNLLLKYYPSVIHTSDTKETITFEEFSQGTERLINDDKSSLDEDLIFLCQQLDMISNKMTAQGTTVTIFDLANEGDTLITRKDLRHLLVESHPVTSLASLAYPNIPLSSLEYDEMTALLEAPSAIPFHELTKLKRRISYSLKNKLSIKSTHSNSNSNSNSGSNIENTTSLSSSLTTSLTSNIEPLVGLQTLHKKLSELPNIDSSLSHGQNHDRNIGTMNESMMFDRNVPISLSTVHFRVNAVGEV